MKLIAQIRKAAAFQDTLRTWQTVQQLPVERFPGELENILWHLAQVTPRLGIEAAPSYGYPSSRHEAVAQTWRYLLPLKDTVPYIVDGSSMVHGDTCSIFLVPCTTAAVDTSVVPMSGDADHWARTLLWTAHTLTALNPGKYAEEIARVQRRAKANALLHTELKAQLPKVLKAHQAVVGQVPTGIQVSIGFCREHTPLVPEGKVAAHHPPDSLRSYSVVCVKPHARQDPVYLHDVVKHELIHVALKGTADKNHNAPFQRMADLLDLPAEYRK